jgi:hypothetical protein
MHLADVILVRAANGARLFPAVFDIFAVRQVVETFSGYGAPKPNYSASAVACNLVTLRRIDDTTHRLPLSA